MFELIKKIDNFKYKISKEINIIILSWFGVVIILFISNNFKNSISKIVVLEFAVLYLFLNVARLFSTLADLKKLEQIIPKPSKEDIIKKIEYDLDIPRRVYAQRNVLDFIKYFPKEHPDLFSKKRTLLSYGIKGLQTFKKYFYLSCALY